MTKGIMASTSWRRKLIAFGLASVILVCAGLLVFATLSKVWTVAMQVASAVAGAGLGSILQVDSGRSVVENQVRSAIRRIFDQASRLGVLVQQAERHSAMIRQNATDGKEIDSHRVADWFESISLSLRGEINSVATSIDDWGDLAHDVHEPGSTDELPVIVSGLMVDHG